MKNFLLLAIVMFTLGACGNSGKMSKEEEQSFANEEVKAIDSSVTKVVKSVDDDEKKVTELLKGI